MSRLSPDRKVNAGASPSATGEVGGAIPTVTARLDDDLGDLLERRADFEGVHKSDIVRKALRAYLV